MGIKYPILHTGCIANQSYTIEPVTNMNMKIDGYPVITSFVWTSKSYPYPTGTVTGNSLSTKIDSLPVIIIDPSVSVYYTAPIPATSLSD